MYRYLMFLIFLPTTALRVLSQETDLQCTHYYIPYKQPCDEARSVSISSDGNWVSCADGTNRLEIWDTNTGLLVSTLDEPSSNFESVKFAPDGNMILLGMSDGALRGWSFENQRKVKGTNHHDAPITNIEFSPDGQRIATVAKNDVTVIHDATTGAEIKRFNGNASSVSWSRDSSALLVGGIDAIQLYNVASGAVVLSLEGADGAIGAKCVQLSSDGKYAVAGHPGESFATVWTLPSGKVLTKLEGHGDEITTLSIEALDKEVCTTSRDGTIRKWDLATGKLNGTSHGVSAILSRSESNTNKRAVTGGKDGEVLIWDKDKIVGALRSHKDSVDGLAISPNGDQISATVRRQSQNGLLSRITWPLGMGAIEHEKLDNNSMLNVQEQKFLKDSTIRARRNGTTIGISHRIESQWSEEVLIQSKQYDFVGMQFVARSNTLIAANHSKLIQFDCTSGQATLSHDTPLGDISFFAASPDGKLGALINNNREMELYSVSGEKTKWKRQVNVFAKNLKPFPASWIGGVDFVTEKLLILSSDGALQLWNVDTGEVEFAHPISNHVQVRLLASCGDGTFVTCSTESNHGNSQQVLRVWKVESNGKKLNSVAKVILGRDEVRSLIVQSHYIASADSSGAIRVWSRNGDKSYTQRQVHTKRRVKISQDEEAHLSKLLRTIDDNDISISTKLDAIRSIGGMKEKAVSAVGRLAALLPSRIEFGEYGSPAPSAILADTILITLGQIGEESVPHLVTVMKHKDPAYSYLGLVSLSAMGLNAKSCGPDLATVLRERIATSSQQPTTYQKSFPKLAIQSLHEMNIDPAVAVPLLEEIALIPNDQRHKFSADGTSFSDAALVELKEYGSASKSAVPSLIKIVNQALVASNNEGTNIYAAAIEALGAIGPDAEDALPALRSILNSKKRIPTNLSYDAEQAIRLIKSKLD